MKQYLAFTKKEWTEQFRSAKLYILLGVFVLFAVMNPAVAKLTPWLFDLLSEELAASGMNITPTEPTALDSWAQFFKNIPTALIVLVILESGIFTKEYRSGTLVMSLTKGLKRSTVVFSKATVLSLIWTVLYALYFGLSYAGTALFWDNSAAQSLGLAVFGFWLFGLWTMLLIVLFSSVFKSNLLVLLGIGGAVLLCTLLGIVPTVAKVLPTALENGTTMVYGMLEAKAFLVPSIVTGALSLLCVVVAIPIFNKKLL